MVPAPHHGGRNSKIIGDRLDCISLANAIASGTTGVTCSVLSGGVLARCDGNNELAFGLEIFRSLEIVSLRDRPRRSTVSVRDRGQGVACGNFVISPPQPHVRGDSSHRTQ